MCSFPVVSPRWLEPLTSRSCGHFEIERLTCQAALAVFPLVLFFFFFASKYRCAPRFGLNLLTYQVSLRELTLGVSCHIYKDGSRMYRPAAQTFQPNLGSPSVWGASLPEYPANKRVKLILLPPGHFPPGSLTLNFFPGQGLWHSPQTLLHPSQYLHHQVLLLKSPIPSCGSSFLSHFWMNALLN